MILQADVQVVSDEESYAVDVPLEGFTTSADGEFPRMSSTFGTTKT